MWAYVALAIGGLILGRLLWMIDDWGRDWTSNHAQWSVSHADPMLHPIEIDADVQQVQTMIQDWVATQPAWQIVTGQAPTGDSVPRELPSDHTPHSPQRLHLTHCTLLFRFIDDVHVEITPMEPTSGESSRCRVDAQSQSRVGKGDLGQNPRNLKELRRGILGE